MLKIPQYLKVSFSGYDSIIIKLYESKNSEDEEGNPIVIGYYDCPFYDEDYEVTYDGSEFYILIDGLLNANVVDIEPSTEKQFKKLYHV